MITRRDFLKLGAATGAGAVMAPRIGTAATRTSVAMGQTPLAGTSIAQFVDPLPGLDVIVAGSEQIELHMREFRSQILPSGLPSTWTWGYLRAGQSSRDSYLGPVIVAERGVPTQIRWVNDLGSTADSNITAYVDSTDQTLHWADPLNDGANVCAEIERANQPPSGYCAEHYAGSIPAVAHLHGGEVPSAIDGGPDAWFTSGGITQGPAFYSGDGSASNHAVYRYPNSQEAASIWFHDHTFGATRLGVYAGLAGAYLIVDPDAGTPANLASPVPLVIQDRMFDTQGQLFFPSGVPYIPNPNHPFWVPEFIGDTICVNGKAWPFMEVEPRRYRFLFLNGSNARGYEMFLVNPDTKAMGPSMWQIGTDGGYLDVPVKIDPNAPDGSLQRLLLLPGERADVIIDFAGMVPGTTLLMRNIAKAPYPGGETPNGKTTGRVMQFRVIAGSGADTTYDPSSGASLRAPMVRLVDPVAGVPASGVTPTVTRQLTLNEVLGDPTIVGGISYPGGPLEILLNNTEMPGTDRPDFTPVTTGGMTEYYSELPEEGTTELWEIVNLTADAHPIHLHLVQFQLMNRQAFDRKKYDATYAAAFPGGDYMSGFGPPLDYNTGNPSSLGGNPDIGPFLKGKPRPPAANEAGWKDTVIAFPKEVLRLLVRWAPTDLPTDAPAEDLHFPFDPDGGHGYVWHCHIIDHEDNEMMRPTSVQAMPGAQRTYVKGTDY
jgi:FtsP/CotA-like multicopper oxidase with cupredoxin domain